MRDGQLAQSIMDGGLSEFLGQPKSKARMYGAAVVAAGRWFPTSKTCCSRGSVNAEVARLQQTFACDSRWRGTPGCGGRGPRDTSRCQAGIEQLGCRRTSMNCRPRRAASGERVRPRPPASGRGLRRNLRWLSLSERTAPLGPRRRRRYGLSRRDSRRNRRRPDQDGARGPGRLDDPTCGRAGRHPGGHCLRHPVVAVRRRPPARHLGGAGAADAGRQRDPEHGTLAREGIG